MDTNVYFGTPGAMLTIPQPRGGVGGSRLRLAAPFQLGSGGQQYWRTLSGKRTYQLGYESLDYGTYAQLLAFDQGHNGPGPFALLDPGQRNLLTPNQSSATSVTNDTADFTISPALSDLFGRTATGGWGNADTGQAWTTVGGSSSDYSVTAGDGFHSLGVVNSPRRTIVASGIADSDALVTVSVPVTASGSSIDAQLVARYIDTNNHYFGGARFNTDGTVNILLGKVVAGTGTILGNVSVLGFTYTPGRKVTIRLRVSGSTVQLAAWYTTGGQTPFQITVTDTDLTAAGSAGCRSLLNSGNTNTLPVAVTFEDFSVTGLTSPLASDSGTVRRGPRSLRWSFGAPSNLSLLLDSPADEWPGIPVVNRSYCFSCWATAVGGSVILQTKLTWLSAAGVALGTAVSNATTVATGAWTQIFVAGTPTAGAAFLNCSVAASGASVTADEAVNLDQFMLNEGTIPDAAWSPGTGICPVQVVSLPDQQPWYYPDYRSGPALTLQEVGP